MLSYSNVSEKIKDAIESVKERWADVNTEDAKAWVLESVIGRLIVIVIVVGAVAYAVHLVEGMRPKRVVSLPPPEAVLMPRTGIPMPKEIPVVPASPPTILNPVEITPFETVVSKDVDVDPVKPAPISKSNAKHKEKTNANRAPSARKPSVYADRSVLERWYRD